MPLNYGENKKMTDKLDIEKDSHVSPFDVAECLTNDEIIARYLQEALESDDDRLIMLALNDVARAKGMTK